MPWDPGFCFSKFKMCIGYYSGYIALLSEGRPDCKPVLQIYSSSGKLISQQLWKDAPPLLIGWSLSEDLLVVQKNGFVTLMDLSGKYIRRFSMGPEAEERGITDAKFFTINENTGVAVLTGGNHIFISTSIETPRVLRLADLPGQSHPITAWELVTDVVDTVPGSDKIRGPWAMVVRKSAIFRTYFGAVEQVELPVLDRLDVSHINLLSVSRSSKFVALYLDNGVLLITNIMMSEVHCQIDLSQRISLMLSSNERCTSSHPTRLVWITDSAVVLQWDKLLGLIGTNGDVYECFIPEDMRLFDEVDSVRVLTPTAHRLLQRVPAALETIGRIGASCPATWLVSASTCLKAASTRTNDYLLPISSSRQLIEAISHCLKAATHASLDTKCQQLLLEAAHMGRILLTTMFAESKDRPTEVQLKCLADRAANICRTLRLLNNLATPWIGIALTWSQFQKLGSKRLFERLLARKQYPMAIEFVRTMPVIEDSSAPSGETTSLPKAERQGLTRVLAHWACNSPTAGSEDSSAIATSLNRIVNELKRHVTCQRDAPSEEKSSTICSMVDFSDVASQALAVNREKVAEQLLEYEGRAWQQVPLLLKLGRYNRALVQAVKSGDPDLISTVIAALQDHAKMPQTDLLMSLRRYPMALAIYQETWGRPGAMSDSSVSQPTIIDLEQDERIIEAKKNLLTALRESNLQLRLNGLRRAEECYKQAKNEFMIQECNAESRLLQLQSKLEKQEFRAPVFESFRPSDADSDAPQVDETSRLIVPVRQPSSDGETSWVGQSLSMTLLRLLSTPQGERMASQWRREFHVSDKRFAYLHLIGLAVQNDCLAEVERLSKTKKPPVCLEVLIKVCIDCNLFEEALKLIPRLPADRRVRFWLLCGQIEQAITTAVEEKSDKDLCLIRERVGKHNRALNDRIAALRQQIA